MPPSSDPGAAVPRGRGRRGVFLVVEGVEGAGKTTQVERLRRWMEGAGVEVRAAREPGGTPVGEAARGILLDRGDLEIGPESELLLLLAARAAFVREVVRPTIDRGVVMLADRFEHSTLAYQGYGRGLPLDEVRRLNSFATGGLRPDLVIILDLPAAEGRARQVEAGKVEDRIEAEGTGFLDRVAEGYRRLADDDEGVVRIDASPEPDRVEAVIRRLVEERFPELFPGRRGSKGSESSPPGLDRS